ncbi:hypothetical protein MNR01_14190 [Lysobacter sp. S4-A87]|uniref:hypothetical protein n=1 Tax=Lysobacter sp. S4-A87 TaxID=2925843 RepID=UPI001F538921|nr:hypothetical protein [Lysobacter sp. S4-A87]UNK48878.1 hypothetical protein MNR01_14190 [Lysobacter sp. S4-A87]
MTAPRRLPSDFSRSAAYPLFAFDPVQDQAWVLHFEPQDYRRASFLDRRATQHRDVSGWVVSRVELEAATDPAAALPLHWLFHIGHCGSSLVSRTLDLLPGVLGLREPLPLLALAHGRDDAATEQWRSPVLTLLARGFADTRAVVVKPTSLVTTLAPGLLAGGGKACLLWVDLQTWLATMLRDEELKSGVLDSESLRLESLELDLPATSDGERLARAWLAEQLRWQRLAGDPGLSSRLLDLDFAGFLADPAGASARLAAHYGLAVPHDWAQRIQASGLLGRYAKDESVGFDAHERRRELAAAATRHAGDIAGGMDWAGRSIAQMARAHPDAQALAQRLRPQA